MFNEDGEEIINTWEKSITRLIGTVYVEGVYTGSSSIGTKYVYIYGDFRNLNRWTTFAYSLEDGNIPFNTSSSKINNTTIRIGCFYGATKYNRIADSLVVVMGY